MPERHFLQSDEWMQFQGLLGREIIEDKGDGWSYKAVVEKSSGGLGSIGKRLYVPYGPTADSTRALAAALQSLRQKAHKQAATYVRLEPNPLFAAKALTALGLKRSDRNAQPDLTLIVDLSKSDDELLSEMSSANRRLWRRIDETGLTFAISYELSDLTNFISMTEATIKRTGARLHSGAYLEKLFGLLAPSRQAGLAFVSHGGKRLGGIFFIDDLKAATRYYMYAASFDEAREHNCGSAVAAYLLFAAKSAGLKYFDFFGISPAENKSHVLAGISAFKRSFGGEELAFSGTWELPVHKASHKLIRGLRPVAKKLKKVI